MYISSCIIRDIDRVIQKMEAKFKEAERYDLLKIANFQLEMNEKRTVFLLEEILIVLIDL